MYKLISGFYPRTKFKSSYGCLHIKTQLIEISQSYVFLSHSYISFKKVCLIGLARKYFNWKIIT